MALAPSAAVLTLGVALGGLSTGIVSPPLAHAVALRVPRVRRDRTQAIVNSGTGLGVALSAPVALLTLEHWRSAWLAFSLAALIVTLWAAFSVPRTREAKTYTVAVRWHGGRRRMVRTCCRTRFFPKARRSCSSPHGCSAWERRQSGYSDATSSSTPEARERSAPRSHGLRWEHADCWAYA
ncbi:MFS transporter [Nesterenkonia pannonica]|uniref:MFS transporter n=1 Tax=Nesterenkonia pannonica TaxID=1548602 RepID=UPI0021645517|nr:MFS transporter [Nesterenkonia pannonica]